MRAGAVLVAVVTIGVMAGAAQAQVARLQSAQGVDWTLDAPKPKAAQQKSATPREATVPPNVTERAAHDAELRRQFFEKQAAPPRREKVPEFGGYDAATMSGDGRTGMGFKF